MVYKIDMLKFQVIKSYTKKYAPSNRKGLIFNIRKYESEKINETKNKCIKINHTCIAI